MGATYFEMPRIAWNDRITKVQVAKALSGKIIVRIDSLPKVLDKDAFVDALEEPDATWATYQTIVRTLSSMFMRRAVTSEVVDEVLAAARGATAAFVKALPPRKYLKSERQVTERAVAMKFDPLEIKDDMNLLKKGYKIFYNVVSAPVQELYDYRDVFRRVQSERKLIREGNSAAAMKRRKEALPDLIERLSKNLDRDRVRVRRIVKMLAEKQARLEEMQSELAQITEKLRYLGADS